MKRSELKQILEKNTESSRRFYRQNPYLYRDLILWEDYLELVEVYRLARVHAPKGRARADILERWQIGENTFYLLSGGLKKLCSDV